jgi:putative ABC transport system substrate-binding protein
MLFRTKLLSGQGASRRCFLRRLAGLAVSLQGGLLLGGCGSSPLAGARPERLPRIGYLDPSSKESSEDELAAFRDEFRGLGYADRYLEERYADNGQQPQLSEAELQQRLADYADELIAQQPDAIVAYGSRATRTLKERTSTVPIVMAASSDPAGTGLVATLAQPEGNVTGLTSIAPQLTGKRLQLLREAFPEVRRIAYLMNPANEGDRGERDEIEKVHLQLGADAVLRVEVADPSQIAPHLDQALAAGAQALITIASDIINRNPLPVVEFATKHRLPAMYALRDFVTSHGGLMAYGPDYQDMYRRAAVFVDKILKGRTPAELPVEKPRRFTLVVNQTAAQTQGLVLPRSFLTQVDEVV